MSFLIRRIACTHLYIFSCFILSQHEWQPVRSLVKSLRSRYNDYAVFFYNEFAPDIIAMIWRPDAFKPQPFSAIASDFKRPAAEFWQNDDLVITNTEDLMAEIRYCASNIVSNFKVGRRTCHIWFALFCVFIIMILINNLLSSTPFRFLMIRNQMMCTQLKAERSHASEIFLSTNNGTISHHNIIMKDVN